MKAVTPAAGIGRRTLVLSVVAGVLFAALLSIATDSARAAYTARVDAGTLAIVGNADSDSLVLRLQAGSPNILEVDVGADGTADFAFDRSTFTAIDVRAKGGDDEVRIDQSGGAFTDEQITIDGGDGADTLIGGSGAETFIGGAGPDFVDGNQGQDLALLGGGADRFQWDPGDSSDVVEGQAGNDTLAFNGSNISERLEASANGSRVRFTRDIASIVMDLGGVERIALRALGGSDNLTVDNLAGTELQSVDVDLQASIGGGDAAADTVTVLGTDGPDTPSFGTAGFAGVTVSGLSVPVSVTGAEDVLDKLVASTLGGDDTATMNLGSSAGPGIAGFDGGEGQDTARYRGTLGDDTIQIVGNGPVASVFAAGTAQFDVTAETLDVLGLDGADTITSTGNLAPLVALTYEGGPGADTLLGGNGNDRLLAGGGDDFVDGNQGQDLALLGGGADRFQWDPGDSSDVVEGQAGNDTLAFNGSNIAERLEASANGSRVRFTRDIASIVMDLAGIEHIALRALGGADNVTVDSLAGTDLQSVDVDLQASVGGGDAAADTVVVNGTDARDVVNVTRSDQQVLVDGLRAETTIVGSEPALDTLLVQTLGGNDDVTVAPDVADLIIPIVDLGDGE